MSTSNINNSATDKVRRAFDLLAPAHHTFVTQFPDDWYVHQVLNCLCPYLSSIPYEELVLDIGCGSGQWASRITHLGYRVHMFDMSSNMVTLATNWQAPSISISQMDAQFMGFASDRFALLLALGDILSYAEKPDQVLYESHRVAKRGAIIAGTVISMGGLLSLELSKLNFSAVWRLIQEGKWVERSSQELQSLVIDISDASVPVSPLEVRSYTSENLSNLLRINDWAPLRIQGIGVLRRLSSGRIDYTDENQVQLEAEVSTLNPWMDISTNLFFAAQAI